ncbi:MULTISPECIES: S1C family serine protease [unclassified Streptomyces]|uniref:S1C family serine protease n=1 Tax=unclassified Streptomyces TaxID=2593676 RepID=UPI002024B099|nr:MULTISPECIES: trypsin-like peptidase domain-containing protein [unclassified Streptomyces]WSC20036.1 trypsin-like peptidase domain-containing protein [Streptomyces sp. NBC_01766]WSV54057.1 trypsin-like peptidase domain-containing protein [Streptomyces sp. NBC_01014]
MDEGKPTGPEVKWWSRPAPGIPAQAQPGPDPVAEAAPEAAVPPVIPGPGTGSSGTGVEDTGPGTGSSGAGTEDTGPGTEGSGTGTEHTGPAGPADRPRPLHEPDPYGTPPYGGPGPWAPAPPVQRPVPTPAQGTPVPPLHAGAPQPHQQHAPHQQLPFHQPLPQPEPSGPQPVPPQPYPQADRHPFSVPLPAPQSPQWHRYDPWGMPADLPPAGLPAAPPPAPRKRRGGIVAALVLALVTGVIGGGVGAYIERNGSFSDIKLPQAGPESTDRVAGSVAGIAASALPSVVTLHVSGKDEQGTGTGFVLDREGHILTNNHVVAPASSSGDITVTFSSGESAKAKVVGRDSGYDLAVVQVSGVSGLTPLPLGNSDNVQVGDPVVAIGAPFDLDNTVTSGIISAKERPITSGGGKGSGSDVSYVDALQTDAPINPGNSGGPLVDTKARVIGINSAIRPADSGSDAGSGQGGSIGLGFAIPINQAKRVAEQLINTGKATHPVIGVTLDMQYTGGGAKVAAKANDGGPAVAPGGAGAAAGIRPGDIVTGVDGRKVRSSVELIVKIRAHRPGDRLALTVRHDGRERAVTLTLGSADGI